MKLSDEAIIRWCIEGDNRAFELLVERYQNVVFGICYHIVGNYADAQDLTQETFVKVYFGLAKIQDHSKFIGWLYRITVNVCKMWLRARKDLDILPLDAINNKEDFLYDVDMLREYTKADSLGLSVEEAIESLPELNRLIVTMYYIDGFSYDEIGNMLNLSESTIKSRLHRARVFLRKEFGIMEKPYESEWRKTWLLGTEGGSFDKQLDYFKEAMEIAKMNGNIKEKLASEAAICMMQAESEERKRIVFRGSGVLHWVCEPNTLWFFIDPAFCTSGHEFRDNTNHPEWYMLWQPMTPYSYWYLGYRIPLPLELNKSLSKRDDHDNIDTVSTIVGLNESVDVPIGIFDNCIKLQTLIKMEGEKRHVPHVSGTVLSYFAPKVGLVKEQYFHSDGDETLTELVDYSVTENPESELPLNIGNRWEYRGTMKSNPVVAKHAYWIKGIVKDIEPEACCWFIPYYSILTL